MPQNLIIERLRRRIRDPEKARTMGTFGGFRAFPITTEETIQVAEQQLGFSLPWLLRELYLKVGNGGFGPRYGIFGITNGVPAITSDGKYHDLVTFYQLYIGDQSAPNLSHDFATQGSLFLETLEQWFDKLVPICSWGCHHYSLLDCSKEEAPVRPTNSSPSFAIWPDNPRSEQPSVPNCRKPPTTSNAICLSWTIQAICPKAGQLPPVSLKALAAILLKIGANCLAPDRR